MQDMPRNSKASLQGNRGETAPNSTQRGQLNPRQLKSRQSFFWKQEQFPASQIYFIASKKNLKIKY